jgi:hypothetical protein
LGSSMLTSESCAEIGYRFLYPMAFMSVSCFCLTVSLAEIAKGFLARFLILRPATAGDAEAADDRAVLHDRKTSGRGHDADVPQVRSSTIIEKIHPLGGRQAEGRGHVRLVDRDVDGEERALVAPFDGLQIAGTAWASLEDLRSARTNARCVSRRSLT